MVLELGMIQADSKGLIAVGFGLHCRGYGCCKANLRMPPDLIWEFLRN
jgi:hypothetical protein